VASGVNGYGKSDYYALRFGKYLIGINASSTQTGTLRLPVKTTTGTELITGSTISDTLMSVAPLTSKVVYLNTISDSMQLPNPPLTFYILAKALPKVYLRWSDASGAVTYNLKRSETQGGPYTTVAKGLTGTSYTDTNGTTGSYYVIAAVNANGESYNSAEVSISGYTTSLAKVTSKLTATTSVGVDFAYSIAALNSPVSFDASGLPNGLSVNKNNGLITGKALTAGTYNVTISIVNTAGTATETLVLTVTDAVTPVITSTTSTSSYTGLAFGYKIEAINGPQSFNATNLPQGFTVDTINGLIKGRFPAVGAYKIALKAINSGGTDTDTLLVTVQNPPLPSMVVASIDTAVVGRPFSHPVVAYYATKYIATNVPAGLSIDSISGEISGIPTTPGLFYVSLRASNATGTCAIVQLPIKIWPTPGSPWIDADVKATGVTMTEGYSTYIASPEAFTLNGAGGDIGGTSDSFHYLFRPLKGDGTFIARLATRSLAGKLDKVGIMMRASSNANATCVFLTTDYGAQKVRFAVRSTNGGTMAYSMETTINGNTVPIWYRIVRSGSNYTGAMSLDGTAWTTVGTASVTMNDSILAGMAVCSRSTDRDISKFDKVSLTTVNTGVDSPELKNVSIYPNPVNDNLRIETNGQNLHGNYFITDLTGRVMVAGIVNNESVAVNMRTLPDGVYLLRLNTNMGVLTTKVIKRNY